MKSKVNLLASLVIKRSIEFCGKVISPPMGKQIYSIIVELTLNKEKCISKTNNKVQHFCFVKSSILNFLGSGFLLDSL